MKKVLCKEEFSFFSDTYFEKGKYYTMNEDSSESCLIDSHYDYGMASVRFYYQDYFPVSGDLPIFEKYFNNIKDIRKQKLNKIIQKL